MLWSLDPSLRACLAGLLWGLSQLLTGCLPTSAGTELRHFATTAPSVGDFAPLLVLTDLDGRDVPLEEFLGEKPLVIQFGSHSCPIFRYRTRWIEGIARVFEGRVNFLYVYTLEAHPVGSRSPYAGGEWDLLWNRWTDVRVRQPGLREERRRQARASYADLELTCPMLVDDMSDSAWRSFGCASAPAFVFDREGRVVLSQVWSDPTEIRRALDALVTEAP